MKEFITKYEPEIVKFSGAKSDAPGRERGRSKLYKIMATRLQSQIARMGYSMRQQDASGGTYFTMTRNSVKECAGVGRIVRGVNTTVDVGPDEIRKQAAKFGNDVDRDGRPTREFGRR